MRLSAADHLIGCITTLAVLGAVGWVVCRILPERGGALARSAEVFSAWRLRSLTFSLRA